MKNVEEGCGCFLILLGIAVLFSFDHLLDVIEKLLR